MINNYEKDVQNFELNSCVVNGSVASEAFDSEQSSKIKENHKSSHNSFAIRLEQIQRISELKNAPKTQLQSEQIGDHKSKTEIPLEEFDEFDLLSKNYYVTKDDVVEFKANTAFLKLRNSNFIAGVLTFISLMNGIIYIETKDNTSDIKSTVHNILLVIISISNLIFSKVIVNLEFDYLKGEVSRKTTIFNFRYIYSLGIETALAIIHPNILTKDLEFTTSASWYNTRVTYKVNEILVVLSLLRSYTIFRFFISVSRYYSPQADRVSTMIGYILNRHFTIKCLIFETPYSFLCLTSLSVAIILSYMLKILEGPAYMSSPESIQGENDLSNFQNCIWTTIVAMTTVGYGNYYPITTFGRFINVIAALMGTIVVSLSVISFQNFLNFTDSEEKAFQQIKQDELMLIVKKNAVSYMSYNSKYYCLRKKYLEKSNLSKVQNLIDYEKNAEAEMNRLREKMKKYFIRTLIYKQRFQLTTHEYRSQYLTETEFDKIEDCLGKVIDTTDFIIGLNQKSKECTQNALKSIVEKYLNKRIAEENSSEYSSIN